MSEENGLAKRILVVDDDAGIREMFKDLLSFAGYQVTTLCDGKEALASYHPGKFDAILMDTEMLESVGYKTCRELRERDPQVPIFGMSGRDYRPQWKAAGATDFLLKPINFTQLGQYFPRLRI